MYYLANNPAHNDLDINMILLYMNKHGNDAINDKSYVITCEKHADFINNRIMTRYFLNVMLIEDIQKYTLCLHKQCVWHY